MANFQGYLIKGGVNGAIFPHQYIAYEGYEATPNMREELKAVRNDNTRELFRITAAGKKNTIRFTTRDKLHLAEIEAIKNFFTANTVNADQRAVSLNYWNTEDLVYKTGTFYIPNMSFPIRKITNNDIIYGTMTYEFIEY